MGKVTDSILSGTSGRTGRIVIANVFGNEISKNRPRKSSKDATAKQKLVNERLAVAQVFLSGYANFASEYFGKREGLRSPYNFATSNVTLAYELDYTKNTLVRNPSKILFSKGNLEDVPVLGLEATGPLGFVVTWENNSDDEGALPTDQVCILYCSDTDTRPKLLRNVATREDGTATVALMRKYERETLHVWICLVNAEKKKASTSEYLGVVEIR